MIQCVWYDTSRSVQRKYIQTQSQLGEWVELSKFSQQKYISFSSRRSIQRKYMDSKFKVRREGGNPSIWYVTAVSSVFVEMNGFIKNHRFKDAYIRWQWSYLYNMLSEISIQWTFNFSDQLDEIHEIWYSTKIDETISILYFIQD